MGPLAEFLSSGADQLARLHWGAAVLAVAAALLWTRVFRPPRLNQMGFWIAIAAGVLAAWLFTAWIDPNVDAAVGDLVRGLGLGSQLDPHPQRITATVIEQILALAALSIVYIAGQVRLQEAPVLATGQGFGIGYGTYLLQLQLPDAFGGGLTEALLLPALAGVLLLAVHIGAAMLLSLSRLNGAYVSRIMQAGAFVLIARYLNDFSEPAWQAGGLAVLVLLVLFFVAGAANRRDWRRP